jgi:threonine/homoserine/homoserine lactone efflux protein
LKIATWNVNSLNVRLPHLLGWLQTPGQQKILNRTLSAMFAIAAVVLALVPRGAR